MNTGAETGRPENATSAHVDRVAIKAPPFWKADPKLWFIQLEAQFELSGIASDTTKHNHAVSAIDTCVLTQVSDYVTAPPATGSIKASKKGWKLYFPRAARKNLENSFPKLHWATRNRRSSSMK